MNKAILANAGTPVQLVFSGLIILLSWFVFQLLAIFSGMLIFSLSLNEAMTMLGNLNALGSINFLKYIQAVTSTGLFIVSSLIIAYITDRHPAGFLYLKRYPGVFTVFLIVLLMILILPFSNLMTELNGTLQLPERLHKVQSFLENKESEMQDIMRRFLEPTGSWSFTVNIIVIALIPAVGEELLFRGVLQKLFIKLFKNPHLGIIITAFIFSALHFQFLTFLPRFMLGIIFGYIVFWSQSLWPAIIAHFINNAFAVIYFHFHYGGKIGDDLELIGSPGHGLIYGMLSFFMSAVVIFNIYKNSKLR